MPHATDKPDLGRAHGKKPDRGEPSGHTPADHAEHRRTSTVHHGADHTDAREKARPRDTDRSGA